MLTDNNMEALTLENRLIKLHKPKYNIKLRTTKTSVYKVTLSDEYPRIHIVRKRLRQCQIFRALFELWRCFRLVDALQRPFHPPAAFSRAIWQGAHASTFSSDAMRSIMGKVSP